MADGEGVKCRDCGFLYLWTPELGVIEAPEQYRTSGSKPTHSSQGPYCFRRKFDLYTEAKAGGDNKDRQQIELEVISNPRDCSEFMKWSLGYDPKEHSEMMTKAELRKMADEQRERDLERQEKQRERDLARQRREKWGDRFYTAVFGLVTFVLGVKAPAIMKWLGLSS